jgi:GGDEF domain-containing protein
MVVSATVSPIAAVESSKHPRGSDLAGRPDRAAELALKAFMSMNRAVAIIGSDGKLLLPNFVFDKTFGGTDLLDRINRDASANNGKSDRQITLADSRAFWVETIPMEDGWLVSAYDMTERSAKAHTDTLTKLGNRLMFHEQLSRLLRNPDRAADGAAIMVIDLIRFKAINESLGRDIGDQLLRCVADRIRSALGPGDIVARLGADKFGIIQTGQPQPAR